jgi:hypothetical protein
MDFLTLSIAACGPFPFIQAKECGENRGVHIFSIPYLTCMFGVFLSYPEVGSGAWRAEYLADICRENQIDCGNLAEKTG